jgi:hypothetical protein
MDSAAFALARRNIHNKLASILVAQFRLLTSWRDSDANRFVEQAVPVVRGSQSALATITSAWLAQQVTQVLRTPIAPPALDLSAVVNIRRGIDDTLVYRRPFTQLYHQLSQGNQLTESVDASVVRLKEIAEFDLQQTYAAAAKETLTSISDSAPVTYWQRVLVGPENCAMCVLASTQRYHIGTLNPIHPGCNCEVQPGYGSDPGQVLDEQRLAQVHAAATDLTGQSDFGGREPDYRKILTTIVEDHGELGPLLVRPQDHFTGPTDLA